MRNKIVLAVRIVSVMLLLTSQGQSLLPGVLALRTPELRAEASDAPVPFLYLPFNLPSGWRYPTSYFDHHFPAYQRKTKANAQERTCLSRYIDSPDGESLVVAPTFEFPRIQNNVDTVRYYNGLYFVKGYYCATCVEEYVYYDGHPGYDWAMPKKTWIYAAAGGTIEVAQCDRSGSNSYAGCHITIRHDDPNQEYTTHYFHLFDPTTPGESVPWPGQNGVPGLGQHVDPWQVIAWSSNTGWEKDGTHAGYGDHLHFEVRHNGHPVDPWGWTPYAQDPGDPENDPLQCYQGEKSYNLFVDYTPHCYGCPVKTEDDELRTMPDALPPTEYLGGSPEPEKLPPNSSIDSAVFVSDVTIPDGTVVSPGQGLNKIWRVRNTGSTIWGSGYELVFVGGDRMSAPSSVTVPSTPPGATADLAVNMTAPSNPGTYIGQWRLRNPQGSYFGQEIFVQITVPNSQISGNIEIVNVSHPGTVTPGQSFWPEVQVRLLGGQLLEGRGDMLLHTSDPYYTDFPHIGVVGTVNAGHTHTFRFYDEHPITAPAGEGTYESRWRVWQDGRFVGPEIVIRFDVRSQTSNHRPNTPSPVSPGDWHVEWDGSQVELCAQENGDPDGDAIVAYQFRVDGANTWDSGEVGSNCATTSGLGFYTYDWEVRVKDSNGAWSDWSDPDWRFTIHDPTNIEGPEFLPTSPSSADSIRVWACSTAAAAMKDWFILANDGSANGEWWQFYEGPDCPDHGDPNLWAGWQTLNYTDGTHRVRVENGRGGVVEGTYTLLARRPAPPGLMNPPDQSYQNTRSIFFTWDHGMFGDYPTRAEQYRLRVSTSPDPAQSPILDVVVDSNMTSFSHTFNEDYSTLYWKVTAINAQGSSDSSAIFRFGIDRTLPVAAVESLPGVSTETVIPVSWGGSDNLAGIRWYDVQYRDGERGEWVDWQRSVETTVAIFRGHPGHTYYFRARALDHAGNLSEYASGDGDTSTTIDPTATPPPPWWNGAYASKRNILVVNDDTDILPAGYPVRLRFDSSTTPTAAELYAASLSATRGDDFRVVHNDTTELNRFVHTFTSSEIEIWFNTQTSISGSGSDSTSYQIYYGNSAATNPPGIINDVFPPTDDSHTVGLWHFQEGSGTTIADSSGNNQHATIHTQTGSNYEWVTDGQMGRALRFFNQPQDGNGAWAEVGNGNAFALPQFTAEAWVRVDEQGVERTIVAKRYGTGIAWQLFLQDGKPACEYNYHRAVPVGDHLLVGEWYHVACTYDGSTLRVYRNGQVVRSETFSAGPLVDSSPLRFGKNADNSNFLYGAIQHIRISDIARTSFPEAQWGQITSQPGAAVGDPIDPPVSGDADLAILDFTAYLSDASLGEGVIVQAVVRNEGDAPTQNGFYTDIYADHLPTGAGDYTGSVRFLINDPIESGETVTLTTLLSDAAVTRRRAPLAPLSEVETTLYAQTDSVGVVDEPDEADNISSGVSICVASADAYEDDNAPENATPIEDGIASQQHNFHGAEDEDWYALNATKGARYIVRTYDLGPSADTYIYLYDTDGQTLLVANDDYDGSLASYLEWVAPSDGTYYVRVTHWNPNAGGCGTSYSISLEHLSHVYVPLLLQNYAPPPPPPELNFYETFDVNTNGWPTHQADCCLDVCFDSREHLSYKYSLWLENGRYHVHVPLDCRANPDNNHGDTRHIMPVTLAPGVRRPLSQTCIEARGSLEQWDAYWSFWGLVFAASEDMDTIYTLEVNNLGNWGIIRRDGYQFPGLNDPLDDLNSQTAIVAYSQANDQRDPANPFPGSNTLGVITEGDTVKLYINGEQVHEFWDPAISDLQYVGLIGGDWEITPIQVGYDYFYVDEGCDDY